MSAIKLDPLHELETIRQQLDRIAETLLARDGAGKAKHRWSPVTDVLEDHDGIIVKMELPEVNEEDITVMLSGTNLIVKGVRHMEEHENVDKHFHKIERSSGFFSRVIPLTVAVEADKIKAQYTKGMLIIHLPKTSEAKPKVIAIHVA